jgi:YidC/Oxa1 family membrane protein insertase
MSALNPLNLLNPLLTPAYELLTALTKALHPLAGEAAVVIALILLTLLARAALLPFAVSVLRSERAKRALAPELERIRRRHAKDPARQLKEVQAAHRNAGISPLAGLLPGLAQAPAMLVIYRLCRTPMIQGAHNALLAAQIFGAPLAGSATATMASAGLLTAPTLAVVLLVSALIAVAALSSQQQVRRLRQAATGELPASQILIARVLPFGTALAALVVPLAVSIYLLTSTAWQVGERAVLPRFF